MCRIICGDTVTKNKVSFEIMKKGGHYLMELHCLSKLKHMQNLNPVLDF